MRAESDVQGPFRSEAPACSHCGVPLLESADYCPFCERPLNDGADRRAPHGGRRESDGRSERVILVAAASLCAALAVIAAVAAMLV